MPNLDTHYLGLTLRSPLVASASILSRRVDGVQQLERAGAGAVVLYSLFEEQIRDKDARFRWFRTHGLESPPEGLRHLPAPERFGTDPEAYLRHLEAAQKAVDIPVIPSLNGATPGGWTHYARLLEQSGAPALELNLYVVATDPDTPGAEIERQVVDIFKTVRKAVRIPLAVKLSPYFSSFAHLAKQLVEAGADGLVLFNRFYQPDVDVETRCSVPKPLLSTSADLRLPLRWVALLARRIDASLAASGGVLTANDALKVILAGADVAMLCSLLLRRGIDELRAVATELTSWMESHGYHRLDEIRGLMSEDAYPDSLAFERGQYIRAVLGDFVGDSHPRSGRVTCGGPTDRGDPRHH